MNSKIVSDTCNFEATAENTGGALLLHEASVPPQAGPLLHINSEEVTFYLLEGNINFLEVDCTFVAEKIVGPP